MEESCEQRMECCRGKLMVSEKRRGGKGRAPTVEEVPGAWLGQWCFERQSEGTAKIYFGEREEERERERERGRERKRMWMRVGVYVPKLCTVYLLCCLSI